MRVGRFSSLVGGTVPGMEEQQHRPRPGWHGIPPSRDRFVPPLGVPAPTEGVTTTTSNAPPIWAELDYPGGQRQTVKGFAMAWTDSLVYVQWIEFSMAREVWVNANVVTRRKIEQRHPHRDE